MADPDLQIGGGGVLGLKKIVFWPFGPQFGLTIRGARPPRAPPLDPPLRETLKSYLSRIFLFENGSRTSFIIIWIIRKLACFVPENKITRIN